MMSQKHLLQRYSRKDLFRLLILWSVTSSLVYGVVLFSNYFTISNTRVELTNNYFQSVNDILTGGFLVDNEKCKIPDVDAWSAGVLPLIQEVPAFDCHNQTYFNLTYVTNSILAINEDVLQSSGYELDDVYCCYNTIERIEQNRFKFTSDADNQYRYSENCFQMEKFTRPKSGFVKVTCKLKNLFETAVYQNYHLIALLPEESEDGDGRSRSTLSKKLSFWKNYLKYKNNGGNVDEAHKFNERNFEQISKIGKPPNILILGLDSTSRLNFRRFMNRTMKVFKDVIKPTEMRGYTKVGENTFPNLVPLFTSFSEKELKKICYQSRWTPQDDCPYIWKLFAKNNYLTALLEDSPEYSIFNYLKTAFVKPPVDMYIRPFMLAAYKDRYTKPVKHDCLRYHRPEEIIMNYIVDLATAADSRNIPYFIISWMTELTHDNMNNLQAADDLIAQRLLQLHEQGLLKNTILLVMGDHGYRFLDVRSTSSGWFEDKLPALWMRLPEPVISRNPSWLEGLESNSNQLLTPFDLHEVFRDVLNRYVMSETPLQKHEDISGLRGISPFTKIPPRTCEEAEIPEDFCSCFFPVEYKSNMTFIKLAGEYLIQSINSGLPSVCQPLSASVITASGTYDKYGAIMVAQNMLTGNVTDVMFPEVIIIAVRTSPGNFYFEAQVSFNTTSGGFEKVSNILRMNKITRSTSCLSSADKLSFEAFCYCDSVLYGL